MNMKFVRVRRPRLLRSYRSVAQKDHGPCCQCQHLIQSGDQYDGYVNAMNGRLWTDKFHVDCPEDWYREEEEYAHAADEAHDRAEKEAAQNQRNAA